MSFFHGAQHTVINGGYFTAQSFQVHSEWEKERYAIQALEQRVAFDAIYNSKDRYDPPKCLPRTREAVFREISEWIYVTSHRKPILWLYGPAGAGKSAIAQSVAEKFEEMNYLLIGTYFFNRSDSLRNNATRLIPTLAYQMIHSVPSTRDYVLKVVMEEPWVFSLNFKVQIEKLILEPVLLAGFKRPLCPRAAFLPMLIIVDGLDECQKSEERTALLQALTESFQNSLFPLIRILCHSRPESDIRAIFNNDRQTSELTSRLVLDDKFNPDFDIQTFFLHQFAEIKAKHILKAQIPHNWPSCEVINELVRKSSGQFIYASTAMKEITSRRRNPMKRLETILNVGSGSDASPFKELDALYRAVLSSVEEEERNTVARILAMICFLPKLSSQWPLVMKSQEASHIPITPVLIDQVLNLEAGETLILIEDLHSLIDVRSPTDSLRPFHASLSDFLRDRSRSEMFYGDPGILLADYTLAYFNVLFSASALRGRVIMKGYPPSRDCFSGTSLTVELLEFLEMFPWEQVLTNVPNGSLLFSYYQGQSNPETLWIWHILETYTFCKMASKRSLAWAGVYQRALRGLATWIDREMALESPGSTSPGIKLPGRTGEWIMRHYMACVSSVSRNMPCPNSELFDMALDVLQTPGLSRYHISSRRHNSVVLKTILEALVLNRFRHADPRIIGFSICHSYAHTQQRPCCQKCRVEITNLIGVSNRTWYLDALLPYIETEVCRLDWVAEEDQCDSIEGLKTAVSRYRKSPITDYYNYNSEWYPDIRSIRAAVAVARVSGKIILELSDVLPFHLAIFE